VNKMSEGLSGFPDCIFYQYHLFGGPNDGEVSNGFRPYFQLVIQGHVYEVPHPPETEEQWVDDGTRRIDLFYKEEHETG
jgi:hypothetical protein